MNIKGPYGVQIEPLLAVPAAVVFIGFCRFESSDARELRRKDPYGHVMDCVSGASGGFGNFKGPLRG